MTAFDSLSHSPVRENSCVADCHRKLNPKSAGTVKEAGNGKLKEVAYQKIDEQTEALVSMIGDNQVDYRFFLGFKLMVTEEQLNLKN